MDKREYREDMTAEMHTIIRSLIQELSILHDPYPPSGVRALLTKAKGIMSQMESGTVRVFRDL